MQVWIDSVWVVSSVAVILVIYYWCNSRKFKQVQNMHFLNMRCLFMLFSTCRFKGDNGSYLIASYDEKCHMTRHMTKLCVRTWINIGKLAHCHLITRASKGAITWNVNKNRIPRKNTVIKSHLKSWNSLSVYDVGVRRKLPELMSKIICI